MKKSILSLCIISMLMGLAACTPTIEPTVSIEPATLDLVVGEKFALIATITPSGTSEVAIWESSNSKVASITEHGVVTAKAEGEAIITLTTDFGSATCVVTVENCVITLDRTSIECNAFETTKLILSKPENKANARVTWNSKNEDIAIVNANGIVTGLAAGTTTITADVSGCKTAECTITVNEVPLSLPRKFLIEHFTGDACGYCPHGMYAITDHITNATTPYIWVSHHAGFNNDEYTILESHLIVNAIGVNGAPTMTLNRTKQAKGLIFHPGYLPEMTTIKGSTLSAMSVEIAHTYDTASRKMDITVSGQSTFETKDKFLLTVLIKENRLVGRQADFYYAYNPNNGWKEYMHARVARGFLTAAIGDTITLENQAYSKNYTYTINQSWVPENCCVVAYLTPLSNQPIINAEQVVLVDGTTGGEQYIPYGITEAQGPQNTITFHQAQVRKLEGEKLLEIMLISNRYLTTAYGNAQAIGMVYLNTDAETLTAGTYPIKNDNSMGSIVAGYRIDEKQSFGGSILLYAVSDYLAIAQIAPAHVWRMNEGEMIVDEQGNIKFNFKTYNGTSVTSTYTQTTDKTTAKVAKADHTHRLLPKNINKQIQQ